ncbi:MAG TPA: C4-dicarboxylate ABC transporter [Rhodobacteraceae bacterium]|jgi:two-component system C4-dicarboxylate transport sensor histidine kinase DctB|nr:C4-dicarboxylate ABC transporter [Paracoccaceae bacterium]
MDRSFARRLRLILAFLAAVACVAAGVWRYGYVQALHQIADRGEADLLLATDRLTGQLQLYQTLAVVTADHPTVTGLLSAGQDNGASEMMRRLADKTGALEIAIVSPAGFVLAASSGRLPPRIEGARYLERGLQGSLGEGHGPAPGGRDQSDAGLRGSFEGWDIGQLAADERTTRERAGEGRAYFFAAPVFHDAGGVLGALLVVVDIERVEAEWRGARPAIWFTDAGGEVFISNRTELLGWRRAGVGIAPRGAELAEAQAGLRQKIVAGHVIWEERWSPYVPERGLYLVQELPVIGMQAETLLDVEPARRLAGLQAASVAALFLAFGAVLFLVLERRRGLLELNERLEARVEERTLELSAANLRLSGEVAERRTAEAALTRAQAELVQAGKLSALGQMSAGISHELNQPLMAIQQYAENAAAYLTRGQGEVAGENLVRIGDMARRMGRIIKNLRAFARQESEPVKRVDLVGVIEAALELAEARLRAGEVKVQWHAPSEPVWVMGGEVRLGQVVVNLLTNAADAMTGLARREVAISLRHVGARVEMEVADSGPGIREPERIFDPFYSTKEVGAGEGMGLGLSISYGLVQSFGGAIRGRNRPEGGAVFVVDLQGAEG